MKLCLMLNELALSPIVEPIRKKKKRQRASDFEDQNGGVQWLALQRSTREFLLSSKHETGYEYAVKFLQCWRRIAKDGPRHSTESELQLCR